MKTTEKNKYPNKDNPPAKNSAAWEGAPTGENNPTKEDNHIEYREFEDSGMKSCSAGDCTGLIPSLPEDEAELESYETLYSFLPRAAGPGGSVH
ncbi:hypothetical protein AALB16_01805 [Lachnospiraceae bacterium 62-35]